jgi:tetratricopeptide (TPR) repeat protein
LGDVAQREMQWDQAQALYEQALSVYEQVDGRQRSLITQKLTYDVMIVDETLEAAQDLYEHVLGLQTGHPANVSSLVTLYTLHDLLMKQGDWAAALETMQTVFGLYEQLRTESGQSDALTVLGSTAAQSGDIDRARDCFAWAVRTSDRLSYPMGEMKALWAWGLMEQRLGNTAAGCALCRQAIMAGLSAPRVYDHERAYALERQLAAMGCEE